MGPQARKLGRELQRCLLLGTRGCRRDWPLSVQAPFPSRLPMGHATASWPSDLEKGPALGSRSRLPSLTTGPTAPSSFSRNLAALGAFRSHPAGSCANYRHSTDLAWSSRCQRPHTPWMRSPLYSTLQPTLFQASTNRVFVWDSQLGALPAQVSHSGDSDLRA